jgi:hypothetical protein
MALKLKVTTPDEAKTQVLALLKDAERQLIVARFNVTANDGVDEPTRAGFAKKVSNLEASIAAIYDDPEWAVYLPDAPAGGPKLEA